MTCPAQSGSTCLRGLYGGRPSPRVCALCWYTGPGWPEVMELLSGTPELAAYHRRRFSTYATCWVPATRRKLVCKALSISHIAANLSH